MNYKTPSVIFLVNFHFRSVNNTLNILNIEKYVQAVVLIKNG